MVPSQKTPPEREFFAGVASEDSSPFGPWPNSRYTRKPVAAFYRYPCPPRAIHRTMADDGLTSRPPFPAGAGKYRLSLLRHYPTTPAGA